MKLAATLIHKSAMPIAIHAVRTFAACYRDSYRLEIHTDGSLDEGDHSTLLQAAGAMQTVIVTPTDRAPIVTRELAHYPRTAELVARKGYFTKIELAIASAKPYFYFDSDIVWLRPADDLMPATHANAFSTESWSWYYGVRKTRLWVAEKIPRRVNSGFYHVGEEFPLQRMETMLEMGMFDPTIEGNGDQEIMAYLFRDMTLYHPEDLKRSRVGVEYDLAGCQAVALHFPGRMWIRHMDQIEKYAPSPSSPRVAMKYCEAKPLSHGEIIRMRLYMMLAEWKIARQPIRIYRDLRRTLAGRKNKPS